MQKLLQQVLTDKTARNQASLKVTAVIQAAFTPWASAPEGLGSDV